MLERRGFLRAIVLGAAAMKVLPLLERATSLFSQSLSKDIQLLANQYYSKRSLSILQKTIIWDGFSKVQELPRASGKATRFYRYEGVIHRD